MAQMLTDSELNGLLREQYAGNNGALRLAQNLAQIFGSKHPDGQTIDGPITIRQPSADKPALRVLPFPGATVPATNIGGGGGGGLNPSQVTFPAPADPTGLGIAFPPVLYGVVLSGGGGSAIYQVRCWMLAPSAQPLGTFACTVPSIDPNETIPVNTPGLVWCSLNSTLVVTAMLFFPIALFQAP